MQSHHATPSDSTIFSESELTLARELKSAGLHWQPSVGHYVWDLEGVIEVASPFQQQVYFILDMKHFLRRFHSIPAMQQRLCWLPTWKQARQILESLNVDPSVILQRLEHSQALESRSELQQLYMLILERLPSISANG